MSSRDLKLFAALIAIALLVCAPPVFASWVGGSTGGGDFTSTVIVSSGSTASASCGQFVIFNSASGAPKTLNIPAPTGSHCSIGAFDLYGDAFTNPITPVPASGSYHGLPVYTVGGSISIFDSDPTIGWVGY